MRIFLMRLSYYFVAFGFVILIVAPIAIPPITSIIAWPYTRHWKDLHGMLNDAIWIFSRGLIITPITSLLLALNDYAKWRGWNQTPIAIISVMLIALLVAGAEYARLQGWLP